MLPENETTMGSIARLLSLDDLVKGIGEESGKWVFDACRGICTEEVKSTLKVLPKSITAFKSFNGVGYPELAKWTELLARDIMKRVELDTARNNRVPKSCTLGYTTDYGMLDLFNVYVSLPWCLNYFLPFQVALGLENL